MKSKEGSIKTVNFLTPGAEVFVLWHGHVSHRVKCITSLKFLCSTPRHDLCQGFAISLKYNVSSCLHWGMDKTIKYMYIDMKTKEGSTKLVNFTIPVAGVLMLGCDHISHYSEYALSSSKSLHQYTAHYLLHVLY